MKNILGLDLGTNSIGSAVIRSITENGEEHLQNIEFCGSRIIPMDAAQIGDFNKGNTISQTADRTQYRGVRRLRERYLLRRERLNRVLNLLGFLPEHYSNSLNRYGKLQNSSKCKLPWIKTDDNSYHFLFEESFYEMIEDFKRNNPKIIENNKKVPYDWTLYYLRKKALSQKIKKEELAWILLNFNQKRGYYQLRGEEETEKPSKTRQYFDKQEIIDIVDTKQLYKGLKILIVELKDGTKGKIFKNDIPNWIGTEKSIIVTIDIDKNGNDKYDEDGLLSCRFKIPTEAEWDSEWALVKMKTEKDIETQHSTVGSYIYSSLLNDPQQKIIGKLVRTIERKFYKDELIKILTVQEKFHPELQDCDLYYACINELYPNNEAYRNSISKRSFSYLLIDDIIFYQRPLKSKKSLISKCPYEEYSYVDRETGEIKKQSLNCISKSHPLFQEFRLWQFISNIRIFQRGQDSISNGSLNKNKTDIDITDQLLHNNNDYSNLFCWLNDKKEIKQDTFLKYPGFGFKPKEISNYRWNYVEDKTYPCNETRFSILSRLNKIGIDNDILTPEFENSLWHILYSIDDKNEIQKALESFAKKNRLNDDFVKEFNNIPPYDKDYGSYSAKTIKKLLSLMRNGSYWKEENIDNNTKQNIDKIIKEDFSPNIPEKVKAELLKYKKFEQYQGLPLWLACYVVYERHSEAKDITKWECSEDIDSYLKSFKQHSLRNPIVEQVILETLRVVRDIWEKVGKIDEIHVELGREMKNPADKRRDMTNKALENENTNLRIKALLTEFANPEFEIENVRPFSPSQQELLKIYEDGVFDSTNDIPEYILKIKKNFNQNDIKQRPSHSDILSYKLWLEQKYRSPYTGKIIPLGKLFTPYYEIEHIIPQSVYFDDSFSNKVICESEVNKMKSNSLAYNFIKDNHGRKVNSSTQIFTVEEYETFVRDNYSHNRAKMKKLLMEDIPDKFIERQLNDSRYISKVIMTLLSNVVREDDEKEAISKNVIPCTGAITDRLKKDWGINDIWNRIILPRFIRLNTISNSDLFTTKNANGDLIPSMPLEYQKGFNKKRIDHRHHAMDAIVIACANRNIVNYLNNLSACKNATIKRTDLQRILCNKYKTDENGNYKWIINKPWETFTQDTYNALKNIIVSFKHNQRIINKTKNLYQHFENGKKILVAQSDGNSWAIRKPLHKESYYGEINLRKIKAVSLNDAIKSPNTIVDKDFKKQVLALISLGYNAKKIKAHFEINKELFNDINLSKIDVYYFTKDTKERFFAKRYLIDESFNKKRIEDTITDTGIKKIMLSHLEANDNNPAIAFSFDGIEQMNNNIISLNNGKYHKPIYKVRVYEKADKFAVGKDDNKNYKFVEAAKGTNLFFAIYETVIENNDTGEENYIRNFLSIPLNIIIERQKQGLPNAPEDKYGKLPKYILSPNDLVYLPMDSEINNRKINYPIDKNRIYKFVSCTGNEGHFIPFYVSNPILQTKELGSNNKAQRAWTNEMIKEICIPITVDRLGNIIKLG